MLCRCVVIIKQISTRILTRIGSNPYFFVSDTLILERLAVFSKDSVEVFATTDKIREALEGKYLPVNILYEYISRLLSSRYLVI